jgi:hypothetical protein
MTDNIKIGDVILRKSEFVNETTEAWPVVYKVEKVDADFSLIKILKNDGEGWYADRFEVVQRHD